MCELFLYVMSPSHSPPTPVTLSCVLEEFGVHGNPLPSDSGPRCRDTGTRELWNILEVGLGWLRWIVIVSWCELVLTWLAWPSLGAAWCGSLFFRLWVQPGVGHCPLECSVHLTGTTQQVPELHSAFVGFALRWFSALSTGTSI